MERLGNSAWSVARGPVIVSREKPGGSDFPSAPNIQQANSVCVSSGSNDGATAFESERTPMVVLSKAAKKHVVLMPNRSGADTGSNHQAALKRMTLLIRTPQTQLDSRSLQTPATALSTSTSLLRNP
jgi:hypothetical protein